MFAVCVYCRLPSKGLTVSLRATATQMTGAPMTLKYAILVDGTIGVGKTTMGRELACRFDGAFIDRDDHRAWGKPWYCSSLNTCRSILSTATDAFHKRNFVFISGPLRCLDWVYFSGHFGRAGAGVVSIGLQASCENITDQTRGRTFSEGERERMEEMIQEGYGARTYNDFYMRTDQAGISATADQLEMRLKDLLGLHA